MSEQEQRPAYSRADPYTSTDTFESRLRSKRFEHFRRLLEEALLEKPVIEILDLGGTEIYWNIARDFLDRHRGRIRITLINLETVVIEDTELFRAIIGDACDPDLFEGKIFDFVHSNSVIEHVGDRKRLEQFARNVLRLGRRHYVQTPNFWFPHEPHFRVPVFQWLPASWRVWMLSRWNLGFYTREPEREASRRIVESINLLSGRDMARLFSKSRMKREWLFGLPKSILAMGDSYLPDHLPARGSDVS